jgi:phosphatidylglycerophosphate synthase
MCDGVLRKLMDPVLNRAGARLVRQGWRADAVTLAGLALGAIAALIIGLDLPAGLALVPLLASRIADGLDGAIARASRKTDFGGFLDIVADFAFYGMIPFAFALRHEQDARAAAFLLLAFYVNGASFLAYAILAEKRGLQTRARGEKSLYFTAGIMEGGETILFLTVICLWPGLFAPLAWGFGALCLVTALARIELARRIFGVQSGQTR